MKKAQSGSLFCPALKIYSVLDLKNMFDHYWLTYNQDKLLVLYAGKNKEVRTPINFLDVLTGTTTAVNPDDIE